MRADDRRRGLDRDQEHGRLVYQDEAGLLDLPAPKLIGRHQIENAGVAIAALRAIKAFKISPARL